MAEPGPITLNVWPHLAPGETTSDVGRITDDHSGNVARLTDVTCPRLTVFRPSRPGPRPAVLVFPGGGYGILSTDLEGTEVARWLNSLGFVAAVLYYRVPNKRDAAFQDAQRALSLVRARAKEFGVDPHRVGVLGFSAGGHLAARLAANYDTRAYAPMDGVDGESCRPDFALLIYPAYLIADGHPAPEVRPHRGMPPEFLMQTLDDPYLDVVDYAKALNQAGVSHHLIVYPNGGHGYGLRASPDQDVHHWPDEAADWLRPWAK